MGVVETIRDGGFHQTFMKRTILPSTSDFCVLIGLVSKQAQCRNHLQPFHILILLFSFLNILSPTCQIANAQSSAAPKPYTLRARERISVTVDGHPEYSAHVSVRPDGFLSYPLVGEFEAAGKTISQIEEQISQALARELDNPRVFIELVLVRSTFVYVMGEVKIDGRYTIEDEQIYLMQALALAGGPDSHAKLTEIHIRRNGKIHQLIDLRRLIENAEADIALQPDDVVFVPSLLQPRPITVTGAVVDPKMYLIENAQIHALQALMMAGGPIQDLANLSRAEIIRTTGERVSVNLEDSSETSTAANMSMLGPGDTLYIPNAYEEEKISLMGAVTRPGQYPVKGPVDMIEALALGGGWDEERANLKKTLIIRSDGKREEIDLHELLEDDDTQSSPLLYPGDRLQIPNRLRINWQALLWTTSAATLIYNILRR